MVLLAASIGLPAVRSLAQSAGNIAPALQTALAATNRVPDLRELLSAPQSEMRAVAQRYQADRGNLTRYYSVPLSPAYYARFKLFYTDWLTALKQLDSAKFSEEGRTEHARLVENIQRELRQLDDNARARVEIAPLIPFADVIVGLNESQRRVDKVDAEKAAGVVDDLAKRVAAARKAIDTGGAGDSRAVGIKVTPSLAARAAEAVNTLRTLLKNWYVFYNDYDPLFTWWLAQPYKEADQALEAYAADVRSGAFPDEEHCY